MRYGGGGGAIAHKSSHVVLGKTLLFSFAEKSWKERYKTRGVLAARYVALGQVYICWIILRYLTGTLALCGPFDASLRKQLSELLQTGRRKEKEKGIPGEMDG